jgi:hypothetical protein
MIAILLVVHTTLASRRPTAGVLAEGKREEVGVNRRDARRGSEAHPRRTRAIDGTDGGKVESNNERRMYLAIEAYAQLPVGIDSDHVVHLAVNQTSTATGGCKGACCEGRGMVTVHVHAHLVHGTPDIEAGLPSAHLRGEGKGGGGGGIER